MNNKDIYQHVDHTLLSAVATYAEIEKLCAEAVEFNTASVCIPPCFIRRVRDMHPKLNICTVIGFPLGYDRTNVKEHAALSAVDDTADELDMVINLTDVKNGKFNDVQAEISSLKKIAGSRILKVIVETCYLTKEEKIILCKVVTDAGADYIKTSTGFGSAGATLADVDLFKKHIGRDVLIKAAGGIKTREDMVAYLQAGVKRLGTSSAVKILTGEAAGGY